MRNRLSSHCVRTRLDRCLLALLVLVFFVSNFVLFGLFSMQSHEFNRNFFRVTFQGIRGANKVVTPDATNTAKPSEIVVVEEKGTARPRFELRLKTALPYVEIHKHTKLPTSATELPPPVQNLPIKRTTTKSVAKKTEAPSAPPMFIKTDFENSSYIDLRNVTEEFADECGNCNWVEGRIPWLENYNSERPWLLVVMPTVPRKKSYLARTLTSIELQIPVNSNLVKVAVVWNMKNEIVQIQQIVNGTKTVHHRSIISPHEDFETQSVAKRNDQRFDFIKTVNPLPVTNGSDRTDHMNLPGPKVRAQTRDVSNALLVAVSKHRPYYVMFMEDDFTWCDGALLMMVYMIRRNACLWKNSGGWILTRFSFGFNGIILHGYDVPTLAAYLAKHQTRRPPDHLMVEWFAGETLESHSHRRDRHHTTYRYNLLEHAGVISSIRDVPQTLYVGCWRPIETPVNFDVELFDNGCLKTKPNEDLSPCNSTVTTCPAWYTAKNYTRRGA